MKLLDEWNKQPFSIYTSEERGVLGLLKRLGKWVGKIIEQLDVLVSTTNKKVSYDDMQDMYNFYKDLKTGKQDYRGTWFGISEPVYSEPGIQGQVIQNINNIKLLMEEQTNFEIYSFLCPKDDDGVVTDWTKAVQRALNDGGVITGCKGKEYPILEGNILIPKDKKFTLDGNGLSFIFNNVVEDTKLFVINHQDGVNNVKRSCFKNFKIDCVDRMRKNICMYLHGSIQIGTIIENVHFKNMGIGIYLDKRSFGHVIKDCYFDYYYKYGIYSKDNSEQFLIQHCWFDYGYKENVDNCAIYIQDITSGTLQNIVIQNCSNAIIIKGARPIVLSDIHLEENTNGIVIGTNNYQNDGIIIDGMYSTSRDENSRAVTFLKDTKYAKKSFGTQIRNACFNNYKVSPILAETNSEVNTSLINVGYDLATTSETPIFEGIKPIVYISNKIKNLSVYDDIKIKKLKLINDSDEEIATANTSAFASKTPKGFNIRWGDESATNQVVYGFNGFSQTGMKLDENGDLLFLRAGVKIAKLASDGLHLRSSTDIKYDL